MNLTDKLHAATLGHSHADGIHACMAVAEKIAKQMGRTHVDVCIAYLHVALHDMGDDQRAVVLHQIADGYKVFDNPVK